MQEEKLKEYAKQIKEHKLQVRANTTKGRAYIDRDGKLHIYPKTLGFKRNFPTWGEVRKTRYVLNKLKQTGTFLFYIWKNPKIKVWVADPPYYYDEFKSKRLKKYSKDITTSQE